MPSILITIDVEDWFQVENLRSCFPPESWDQCEWRVEQNTRRLLSLFERLNVKATFFILGRVAEQIPDLVLEIDQQGHEVASHGYGHWMCDQIGDVDLKEDLKKSKILLEGIIKTEVKGYRAPNFSISNKVLHLVRDCGYHYDSSYNNFNRHGRYGEIATEGYSKQGVAYQLENQFYELPVSNLQMFNTMIPWGGGGYFRFFPIWLYKAGMRYILNREGAFVFYMHPWEIDPGQPKVKDVSGVNGWKHYLNLDKTYGRLENLIKSFADCEFMTCSQYLRLFTTEGAE